MKQFGLFIRQKREALLERDPSFSQRQVSQRIGIEQSYLSKIERGVATKLSEEKILALAHVLDQDPDFMLALGGKVSNDVLAIIQQRPLLFSRLVREMKNMPEDIIEADHDTRQRQSRISRLYQQASIGFFHLENTPDSSVWSLQTPKLLHISPDIPPGLDAIRSAFVSNDADRFIAIENAACKAMETYSCELRLKGNEGDPAFVRIWGDFEAQPDGEGVIRLGLIQDVSESVLAREELQKAYQALSGTLEKQNLKVIHGIESLKEEVATRKALEVELRETNADVQNQKDLQRGYLQQAVYELRSLASQLAIECAPNRGGTLTPSISNIAASINNMNDFFEIESGISPLLEICNPQELFDKTIKDITGPRKRQASDVQLICSPQLPEQIKCDSQRLQQITTSILGFLLKKTSWGVIQLTLDYVSTNNMLNVVFSAPALSESLPRDFFYPTPRNNQDRASWPLATVGPIVDSLGGNFTTNQTSVRGLLIALQVPSEKAALPPPKVHTKLPILIVEDDESSRFFAEHALTQAGHEVEAVASGAGALKSLERRHFGLVLLDIQLPDVDGVTVAYEIRNGTTPNTETPIIAVTAHVTPADRRRYAEAGIQNCIAKPYKIDTLTALIENNC